MHIMSSNKFGVAPTGHCPCLSGEAFGECCEPFHRRVAAAPTAERLMRSRYSAFAVGDAEYLLDTWHASTRPRELTLDDGIRWYRLDILATTGGGMLDATGTVEFRAYFREAVSVVSVVSVVSGVSMHELSRFRREGGRWYYLDGDEPTPPLPQRF